MRIGLLTRPGMYVPGLAEVLNLVRFREKPTPLNAGWTVTSSGSGSVAQHPDSLDVATGTTANSYAYAYACIYGLNPPDQPHHAIDFNREIIVDLYITRNYSDAQAVAEFHLGEFPISWPWLPGQSFNVRAFGIRIDNFTLVGEAQNTSYATVNLGVTMSSGYGKWVTIRHIPGVEVGFYIDGEKKASITSSNAVPSGIGGGCIFYAGIKNGSTGGVNAMLRISSLRILQRRW